MLLQVQRVSTVISHTEMRWENAIEKIETAIQKRVWVRARKLSSRANSTGELRAPDTENVSKQQSNDTQCTATHSRLWSKETR